MTRRLPALFLLTLLPTLLAGTCNNVTGSPLIDLPLYSPAVTTANVEIQVTVPATSVFDPNQDIELNGIVVPMTGGPSVYTATLPPGSPLLDDNVLTATALKDGITPVTRTRNFQYLPPKARARRIADASDLIQGPLAHGKIGDYILENDVARFIVQDVGQRDMYSVGAFGGNVIDAELKSRPGLDNFIEVTPMLDIETVVNATTLTIVNDGLDGLPAVIRTCGPDDLLDFVNPSTTVRDVAPNIFPVHWDDTDLPIQGCTDYTLAPGVPHLEMRTEVFNDDPTPAAPAQPLFVGDWLNPGGQLDRWSKDEVGWGEGLNSAFEALSFVGIDQADGAEYAWVSIPSAASPFGSDYFATSGVFVVLHNFPVLFALLGGNPPFAVPAGGSLDFTRYLAVGDGTGSAAVQLEADVAGLAVGTIEGCVTVGGVPLPGSRVSFGQFDGTDFTTLDQTVQTSSGGCPNYSAPIVAGTHEGVAGRRGTPYEGGGTSPQRQTVVVTAGVTTSGVDFALPATGQLEVSVTDEAGTDLPARVTVVGFDPSPEVINEGPVLTGFGAPDLALLHDDDDDLDFGVVAFDYTDASGSVTFDVEPGSYQVCVSRGTEYSIFEAPLSITAGATTSVSAQIGRVLDTPGFVSSDFHVHGIRSADSRVPDLRRVLQFAGEGIENVVMTDHGVHTDLTPEITAAGLGAFLAAMIGEEITTFDYGHMNGYPFTIDPSRPSGGSTDWGKAAPAGEDFPSFGNYNATPAEIWALATTGPQSLPDTTAQVNHFDDWYGPLQVDTSVAGPITDGLDEEERSALRLPASGNLYFHFPALEVWNGMDRGHQAEYDKRIGVWMNQLNKGLFTTAIADTDTHSYRNLRTAGARTWTASTTDSPASIDPNEVARSVDAGRAVGGQGIYVQTRLLAQDGSGGIADLTLAPSSTMVASSNGNLDLEIRVQAPTWAPFDRIEIFTNATTTAVDPAAPYQYTATPNQTLLEGDCDPSTTMDGQFDISLVDVHPTVPGAERQEVLLTVPFTGLTVDTWFVVNVRGTDGVCGPMFPVFAADLASGSNLTLANLLDGNVSEQGVTALGITNALYADVDGTAGFQPPNP